MLSNNHTTSVKRITFHATYRNYFGYLLRTNALTGRARIMIFDDVLSGGCWRVMFVDLDRVLAVLS